MSSPRPRDHGGIDLYWLPLGAGGHSVRLNGRIFEALAARRAHRRRYDLYHSALVIRAPEGRFVVEMAPVPKGNGAARGVAAEGTVGSRHLEPLRVFRYEVRRWRDGVIPDIEEAVGGPQRVSGDADVARRALKLVPDVPTPVWGRDQRHTGDMWTSNSLTSWLLTRTGIDTSAVAPPPNGRAPGWHAGIVVARRDEAGERPRAVRRGPVRQRRMRGLARSRRTLLTRGTRPRAPTAPR